MSLASKKILLAGTALVALSSFAAKAHADAIPTLTANGQWAADGAGAGGDSSTAEQAVAGDTINIDSFVLTVKNDNAADDGSGDPDPETNVFTLGAVTGSSGTVNITTADAHALAVETGSITYTGAGSLAVANDDESDAGAVDVTIGSFTNVGGGSITVTNTETTIGGKDVTLTATGSVTNTGTTTITAGGHAPGPIGGDNATVELQAVGNTFTGAVTLNGGVESAATLKITGNGGTTAFNGGLVLNDGTGEGGYDAALDNSGAGAKTINGAINGATAGEGVIYTNSTAKTTFGGAIGGTDKGLRAITLANSGGADFNGTVRAATVTVSGTGTNTFKEGLTGDVAFTGDGTVVVSDSKTLTGGVTSNANGTKGTLTFEGAGHITGDIGDATHAIKALNAGVDDVAFDGKVYAKDITVSGTGELTFAKTVGATDITFGDAGSIVFNDDVLVSDLIDFDGQDGTLTIAKGKSLDADIDTVSSGGHGTVVFAGGAQQYDGVIGNVFSVAEVKAGQGADAVTTFTNAVYTDAFTIGAGKVVLGDEAYLSSSDVNFAADGTLELKDEGTGATMAPGGSITAAQAGTGTINVDGTATLSPILTQLKALNLLGTGKTVSAGNTVAAKTVDLGDNLLDITGTYAQASGDTLISKITDDSHYGQIAASGVANLADGAKVKLNFDSAFTSGAAVGDDYDFDIVTGGGDNTDIGAVNVSGSALWDLTINDPGSDDLLQIHAVKKDAAAVVGGGNNATVLSALQAAVDGGATGLQGALDTVNGASTAAELQNALQSLQPTVDGAATQGALLVSSHVEGITTTRLASLRDGDLLSGVAAGSSHDGRSLWVQGFGSHGSQDERGGIKGYDSDVYGGAVGFDTADLLDDASVGVAFAYGNVSADSNNANRSETDIDSYGVTLYGSANLVHEMFLDAAVGYAYNDIDQLRHDTDGVAGSNNNSSSNTNSSQYNARVALGRDYHLAHNTVLTPSVSADYTHLDVDGYHETGTGNNLTVQDADYDKLNLGFDVKAAWNLKAEGANLKPSVHAGYAWDAVGDRISNTAAFTAGGPAFQTNGANPARSQGQVGAGIVYASTQDWDLSANYNYTFRSDYDEHAGVLRVTSRF